MLDSLVGCLAWRKESTLGHWAFLVPRWIAPLLSCSPNRHSDELDSTIHTKPTSPGLTLGRAGGVNDRASPKSHRILVVPIQSKTA